MVNLNLEFPDSFFKEEERSGFLVTQKIKELWAVELDLLMELERVCKKHHIKYFVMFGTLLGAVRHKGFIPWDDDIDVAMERSDFNKLMSLKDEFKSPYFLQTEKTDKGCHTFYAKLRNSDTAAILKPEIEYGYRYNRGIFLDIFIMDPLPNDKKEEEEFRIELRKKRNDSFRWARMFDSKKFNSVHKAAKIISPLFKIGSFFINLFNIPNVSLNNFEKLARKYEGQSVTCYTELGVGDMGAYNKEWYKEIVYLPFEHIMVPCPKEYEKILVEGFGDWKEFVIGAQDHTMSIIDTNKSYKEYD